MSDTWTTTWTWTSDVITIPWIGVDCSNEKQKNINFDSITNCVSKIAEIIPGFNQMVQCRNVAPSYSPYDCEITMCTLKWLRNDDKKFFKFFLRFINKKFKIVNKKLLIYFILLHEYGHSKCKHSTTYTERVKVQSIRNEQKQMKAYRNLKSEKFCDKYAERFIKENWDFLMS